MIVIKLLLTFLVTLAGWLGSIPGYKDVQAAAKAAVAVHPNSNLKVSSAQLSDGIGFCSLAPTRLTFSLRGILASIFGSVRRHFQRRRLYVHNVASLLEGLALVMRGFPSALQGRLSSRTRSAPDSHDVHDWHEARPDGFLTPLEVAECRMEPDVHSHVQRLLQDRWTKLKDGTEKLEVLPEDERVLF